MLVTPLCQPISDWLAYQLPGHLLDEAIAIEWICIGRQGSIPFLFGRTESTVCVKNYAWPFELVNFLLVYFAIY